MSDAALRQALLLAGHELRLRFADPLALGLAVAAPLALFALIALAFGGSSGSPSGLVVAMADDAARERLQRYLDSVDPGWARVVEPAEADDSDSSSDPGTVAADVWVRGDHPCGAAGVAAPPVEVAARGGGRGDRLAAQAVAAWLRAGCPPPSEAPAARPVAPPGEGHGPSLWLPSLGLFFLGFSLLEAARSLLAELRDGRLHRLRLAGVRPAAVVVAKMAGASLAGLLQFTVLAAAAGFLFDYDWGGRLGLLAILVLAMAATCTGLGLLVASLVRTAPQALAWGGMVLLVSALVGGVFQPDSAATGWLAAAGKLSFHAWALEGFRALLDPTLPTAGMVVPVVALTAFAVAATLAAAGLLRRRLVAGGAG